MKYRGRNLEGFKRISQKADNAFSSVVKSTGDIKDALSEWLKADERIDVLYLGKFSKGKILETINSLSYLKQYEKVDTEKLFEIENILKVVGKKVEALIEDACKEDDSINNE